MAAQLSDIIQHFEVNSVYKASYVAVIIKLRYACNFPSQSERGRDLATAVRYLTSDRSIASTIRKCLSLQINPTEVAL